MSDPDPANDSNLTGVWDGLYRQPGQQQQVPFTATLIDTGSLVSGSTHEPCNVPGCLIETHQATLSGERAGRAVSFTKSYDPPGFGYGVVGYAGTLSADGMEIAGHWRISRSNLSGEFLMIRAQRKTVARKHTMEHVAPA
ncbi:MAG: hypothetical protein R3D62_13090 [Xanthobacteraceae bacterium]